MLSRASDEFESLEEVLNRADTSLVYELLSHALTVTPRAGL